MGVCLLLVGLGLLAVVQANGYEYPDYGQVHCDPGLLYTRMDFENVLDFEIKFKDDNSDNPDPDRDAYDSLMLSGGEVLGGNKDNVEISPLCNDSFQLLAATMTTKDAKRVKYTYYPIATDKVAHVYDISDPSIETETPLPQEDMPDQYITTIRFKATAADKNGELATIKNVAIEACCPPPECPEGYEFAGYSYHNQDPFSIKFKDDDPAQPEPLPTAENVLLGSGEEIELGNKDSIEIAPDCGDDFYLTYVSITVKGAKRVKVVYYENEDDKSPTLFEIDIEDQSILTTISFEADIGVPIIKLRVEATTADKDGVAYFKNFFVRACCQDPPCEGEHDYFVFDYSTVDEAFTITDHGPEQREDVSPEDSLEGSSGSFELEHKGNVEIDPLCGSSFILLSATVTVTGAKRVRYTYYFNETSKIAVLYGEETITDPSAETVVPLLDADIPVDPIIMIRIKTTNVDKDGYATIKDVKIEACCIPDPVDPCPDP